MDSTPRVAAPQAPPHQPGRAVDTANGAALASLRQLV